MQFVSNRNLVFQRATFQNFTRTIKIGLVVSLNSPAPSSNNNHNNDNNDNKIHILRGDLHHSEWFSGAYAEYI